MHMPHNSINKFQGITLYFFRGFSDYTYFNSSIIDLAKMRFPLDELREYPEFVENCVATMETHFSGAFYWSAPFLFSPKIKTKPKGEKTK